MYGLLVHMLISSHFFHGFVSSKKNTQWNLCVLKASAEKKTFFFLSCSIVCFLGQFAQCFKQLRPHVHSEQKRPNIFLQTMVVTSGGLVAAAKLFRYVSFQLECTRTTGAKKEARTGHQAVSESIRSTRQDVSPCHLEGPRAQGKEMLRRCIQ